jgi:hypothetical protein
MKIQSAMQTRTKIFCFATLAIAIGVLSACGGGSPSSDGTAAATNSAGIHDAAPQAVTDAKPPSADFPAGTVLGDLDLPVYPTPPENTQPSESNSNEAGEKSVSVSMTPQDPFVTVVAWYKAHMPAGSYVEGANPNHAQFQIGDYGDKMMRLVIIDNANDTHAHLILIKKTNP